MRGKHRNDGNAPGEEAALRMEQTMEHETINYDISELKPHPRNYRSHPEDQIDHLVRSIEEHGFYRPVVVARDGTILAGHGIVQAAKRMGLSEIPAVVIDIAHDDPKALKILTGDNEVGRLAEIDDRMLSEILKDIKDMDELVGTGFNPMMLANLVMVTRPQSEINDINEAAEWVGMPEYEAQDEPLKLTVSFEDEEDRRNFMQLIGVGHTRFKNQGTWSIWWPEREREDPSSLRFSETRNG